MCLRVLFGAPYYFSETKLYNDACGAVSTAHITFASSPSRTGAMNDKNLFGKTLISRSLSKVKLASDISG